MLSISAIVREIAAMASTVLLVAFCISVIWALIWPVALEVWLANALTSCATTANPLPASPGSRRFDGGVQREQVGLFGDVGNHGNDGANLIGGLGETTHHFISALGLAYCVVSNGGGLADLTTDLGDGCVQFLRCRRDGLDIAGRFLRRTGDEGRLAAGVFGDCRHTLGRLFHLGRSGGNRRDDAADSVFKVVGQPSHQGATLLLRLAGHFGAFGLHALVGLGVGLEDLYRVGHAADLVATATGWHVH